MKRFAIAGALKARLTALLAPVLLPVLELLIRLLGTPERAAAVPEDTDRPVADVSNPADPLSPLNPVNTSSGIPASLFADDINRSEDQSGHRDFEADASDFQSDSFICDDNLDPTADIAECSSGSPDAFSSNDF